MELRIRCPQCRTVLKVKPGTRPSCPGCGFAGAGAATEAQAEPVEFTSTDAPSGAGWSGMDAGGGAWDPQDAPEGQPPEAEGAPGEASWEDTGGGWGTQPPQAEPKRKRFRLFSGRS